MSEQINIDEAREFYAKTTQIDEMTYRPACISADEIEIAGVEYVRKNLRKSHSVNERLLSAATDCFHEAEDNPCMRFCFIDDLKSAIAGAEASIAERAKPVTEAWCRNQGWPVSDDRQRLVFSAVLGVMEVAPICGTLSAGIQVGSRFASVRSVGDVLDLVRILGAAI
jgi:hypothetical protein